MNINFISPINLLSYGYCGFNCCRALDVAGHRVSLFNREFGPSEIDTQSYPRGIELLQKWQQNSVLFDPAAPSVRLFHQHNLSLHAGKGTRIGFPIFELTRFSSIELHHLNSVDKLFVCSNWAKGIIENNGIKVPCFVVPLGCDLDIFHNKQLPRQDNTFRIGNISKYESRKNQDGLVNIFNRAFETTDDVALYLSCENIFNMRGVDDFKKRAKNTKMGSNIHFIPRLRSQIEINDLHNHFDAECYPSKAEGWNMPAHESLVCGNPTVLTNYSAHTEYANKDEAILVDIDEMETAHDGIWFKGQGEWGKIGAKQEDKFASILRELYRNRPTKTDKPFARSFTWENTANHIVENL